MNTVYAVVMVWLAAPDWDVQDWDEVFMTSSLDEAMAMAAKWQAWYPRWSATRFLVVKW